MFKFKGISSEDMQVIIEEEEHFIARASKRYETIEIEGRDGAIFNELGYSVVERPIYVQCLNINKIDDILAWLNGEGEFEYKGRKTTARFYSQLEPQRSSCIRIIDTTFIRDPFWYKANEEYILSKDRKDKTLQGEIIDITDSAEAKITELNISGNSKQKTSVEGKNKFDSKNVSYYTRDSRETYIINSSNSITVNGTECSWTRISITIPNLKPSTEYTISAKVTNASNHNAGFLIEDDNNVVRSISTNANFTSKITFITDSNGSITIQVFSNWSGTVLTESVTYDDIQLEEGETVTEYEEFEPNMPSSNYPSEVESCGDNINYFKTPETATMNGVTLTKNKDGSFDLKGTATAKVKISVDILNTEHNIKNGDVYAFSCKQSLPTGVFILAENYNNTTWLNHVFNIDLHINRPSYVGTVNIAGGDRIKYSLVVDSGTTVDIKNIQVKVEKGSTVTPYSPYGQGCINEVVCNKNILDMKEGTYSSNGLTAIVKDGEITINGTNTTASVITIPLEKTIKAGTKVTISTNNEQTVSASTNPDFRLDVYSSSSVYFNKKNNFRTYTTVADITSVQIRTNVVNITYSNFIIKPQVEYGDTSTDYIQHQSQIYTILTQQPMRSVEEIRDTFIKKKNKWYERHLVKRVIFDGTESWSLGTEGFFRTIHENLPSSPVLCNQLNNAKTYQEILEGGAGFIYSSLQNLYMNFSKYITFTTVDEFKTYLAEQYNAGTPVYVDYVLAEPIDIECTEEQSEILWDIEQNAKTYDKVTHIYSTDEISPVIELIYFTPTNETINNEGNIQSRPILRLEKTVSEAVELTINDIRFKYDFGDDSYTEIDCEEKTVKYEGLNRNRKITIGYEFPKLNIGSNKIVMHDGDCIIKILRKDRWL